MTREQYNKLIELYNQAVKDNRESFIIDGSEILTSYAKYLIEYLSDKFENTEHQNQ